MSYIVTRAGKYLKYVCNMGVRHDGSPVPDFMTWTDDVKKAKAWKTNKVPNALVALHAGMTVAVINTTSLEYDGKKYQAAINTLAEQLVAMVWEDGGDRDTLDDYVAEATSEINTAVEKMFRTKR